MGRTYNVIDADGHVLEPMDMFEKYMDPSYRERAPQLIVDTDGKERLLIEGKIYGSHKGLGLLGAIGARQGAVSESMKYVEGRKGGFDPHARIVDMDLDGIDAAFLYPSIGLFSGAIADPKLAAAACRGYNRWLADYCQPYPDRLFGVAMLPMQSIELAIDEMRFARMDRHFDDEGFNDSGLSMRPSELFRRNCWISFEPVEGSLSVLAEYIGPHKILWATDYPHPDGFFPGAPALIANRPELSAETKRQILAGGAMGFYALS